MQATRVFSFFLCLTSYGHQTSTYGGISREKGPKAFGERQRFHLTPRYDIARMKEPRTRAAAEMGTSGRVSQVLLTTK